MSVVLDKFHCRSCCSNAGCLVLDLGRQPLANNLPRPEDLEYPEPSFPLRLAVCTDCWLLQILDVVPPVNLFSEYVYFSSYSDLWLKHAEESARRYMDEFSLGAESWVVEVASNDGYLLRHFAAAEIPHLGIEPAGNVAQVAREKGVETRVDFFNTALARDLAKEKRADLIVACNVFAHVPDPNDFGEALRVLLGDAGTAILEFPHAAKMISYGEFDTVYHEHVFYFTLTALEPLFERHGLRVVKVEELSVHGGSLRIFVRHKGCPADDSVSILREHEEEIGVGTTAFYDGFAKCAQNTRKKLREFVESLRGEGKRLAAYGAAAKGAVLMNYCGLDSRQIDFVADRSPHKQGRLMPGVRVPIKEPGALREKRPDVVLLLAWNFADEIQSQQSEYRELGGRFLIPLPEMRLV
ncbi:MAG: methyltransferase [Verrucomicrobiales bacterium]|nr:methyltransferase [Verrucomicrobiales bacterium]MBL68882.1 methyltransferase [Verrucomicrobiales bacterium]